MKLRLFNYWRSSASYRVRIGLGLKGLAYEYVVVDILHGGQQGDSYRAHNPMAQVPTLELLDDDGADRFLVQSLPILEYLDERWPSPPLLPSTPELRHQARALAEIINTGIQPLQNLTTMRKVKAFGGDEQAWTRDFIIAGLAAFDAQVASSAGRFCVGDAPSLPDCFLVPQLYASRRFGVDLATWPRLVDIAAACNELPAFAAARPDAQPDAVKP